ncbi:MAG: hypothetical protein LAP21_19990 [Acidobacteriia bacterium]|nr:hypothetical protein [Terriglobia bacterium]
MLKHKHNQKEAGMMGSLILIPGMLIGGALSLPAGLALKFLWRRRERRLMIQMASSHRLMDWNAFVQEVDQSRGTVIIEQESYKGPTRWWWTPDDVDVQSPHPVDNASHALHDPAFHPFYAWCHETYTNAATGRGMLISCTPEQRRSFKDKIRSGRAVTTWPPPLTSSG